ncbi:MAG: hypothetical protein AB7G06_03050 [Bdellovibrionales bacterium]
MTGTMPHMSIEEFQALAEDVFNDDPAYMIDLRNALAACDRDRGKMLDVLGDFVERAGNEYIERTGAPIRDEDFTARVMEQIRMKEGRHHA